MKREKLITIVGPTASGKSDLGMALARKFHFLIISGDAYQVYKGMDIGTAKESKEEREEIPHALVDILSPGEPYSAARFQQMAEKVITEENRKGSIPILVGGTGLYVQGLLEGYTFLPQGTDRKKWEALYEEKGTEGLKDEILRRDPAAEIPKDRHRMIRKLELLSSGNQDKRADRGKELRYDGPVIGISMDRARLYDRINKRVAEMMQKGLLQEVQSLLKSGVPADAQSMQGIGYKEMIPAIEGKYSLQKAEFLIQRNTRHFAKRQMTWYRRRMPYIHWFDRPVSHTEEWHNQVAQYIISYFRGEENGR